MLNKGSSLCLCSDTAQVREVEYSQPLVAKGKKVAIFQWLNLENYEKEAKKLDMCGQTWVGLKCSSGHEKYIKMHCKYDFCPTCGKKDSMTHKRRYVRALDRLVNLGTLGEVVFTLPEEISASWLDKETLGYLEKQTWQIVLQNFKTEGGVVRMHPLGDKGNKLHVHFNVLFPINDEFGKGEVSQSVLNRFRSEWTKVVNDRFKANHKRVNCFYKFAPEGGRRIHRVKYVFRPIATADKFLMLSDNDKHWIISLVGWHNTRWYGKLANAKYKKYLESKGINPTEKEDSDVGLSSICPVCGGRFKHIGIFSKDMLPRRQLRYVDDDVLVDFEIWNAIQARDKWKVFDSGLSFEDIVKQYS